MKIVFTGGGTLGHIYPSFPVIKRLKEEGNEVYFIGGKRQNEEELLMKNDDIDNVYLIDLQGFKRKISLYNFVTIKKYFKALKITKKIISEINPDVVIGMGGYVSAPVLKVANKMKINTLIHEQNSVYGLVNKILKKKVDKVLLAYDIEKGKKIELVGNPRTSEFLEKYKEIVNKKTMFRNKVLVVGGSLGAEKINNFFIEKKNEFKKRNIEIILITGKKYYEENKELIEQNNSYPLTIIPFSNQINELMIDAKMVVSRSGATTISELLGLNKVALFIPSPNVTNNHQYKNARYYVDKKCAFLIEENDIEDKLFRKIIEILSDENIQKRIKKNINNTIIKDSTERFYKEIIKVVRDKNG